MQEYTNVLSVDYERSISFRKWNRWKSFEIVHVCLNNKNVITFNTITMLDSDSLVEGWASIACDPKFAGSILNRFVYILLVLCFRSAVLLNKIKL